MNCINQDTGTKSTVPHLVSTANTTGETRPDTFEVTIDEDDMVKSTAKTLSDDSVRLYFDLASYTVGVFARIPSLH